MDLVQFPVDEAEYSTGLYFHVRCVWLQKGGSLGQTAPKR